VTRLHVRIATAAGVAALAAVALTGCSSSKSSPNAGGSGSSSTSGGGSSSTSGGGGGGSDKQACQDAMSALRSIGQVNTSDPSAVMDALKAVPGKMQAAANEASSDSVKSALQGLAGMFSGSGAQSLSALEQADQQVGKACQQYIGG
jgi:hypothetical protein